MKQLLLFLVLVQGIYIIKLKNDLYISKQLNKDQILKVLEPNVSCSYSSYNTSDLSEPSDMNGADILDRIDMLGQHLSYSPSIEWIREVSLSAKKEIVILRTQSVELNPELQYRNGRY